MGSYAKVESLLFSIDRVINKWDILVINDRVNQKNAEVNKYKWKWRGMH